MTHPAVGTTPESRAQPGDGHPYAGPQHAAPPAAPQRPALLTPDAILAADDIAAEYVEVPEWGGTVRVRGLDGRGRDEFEAAMAVLRGKRMVPDHENIRAKLAARCLVDEDGNLLFTQHDVWALGQKSAAALDRIFAVASRLSGLEDEDIAELEGNSPGDPNGGSTSS